MAVEIKVAPDEKLQLVSTLLIDQLATSEYFNISELTDVFTGGKNAFLIAGSNKLVQGSEIRVQIRDSNGKVIYVEFSNGYPYEYYEGVSKVCSVHIYPTETAFGPATITILGVAKDVPAEWQNKFNVKWEKTIQIDPSQFNITKVRFYKRPQATISEILSPVYRIESGSKVPSNVTASFADIKISRLDTFAGDVKRVKVFRTSEGDISDYDLIQDILLESKNLLTTYNISASVVGDAGLFNAETIKLWNTGSLNVVFTNDEIDNGIKISGSGDFIYNSYLNLDTSSVYEFGIDAYYKENSDKNLEIYLSGSLLGTQLIGTLYGTSPTKNLLDTIIQFQPLKNDVSASLKIKNSGEWHIGNISLKNSQDTAFSPNSISFITSMPTVIGNETFNFKFEFYDVNNNYIPVAVTQSATFTGGNNNVGGTLTLISGSITEFSQSYFEDVFSGSNSLSGSLSSSISKSASEVSASSANFIILVSGSLSSSINVVSGSQYVLSQSVSSLSASFDSRISSSQYTANSQSLYQVYSASAFLDKFIFTDENGKLNSPPTASGNGLYLGSTYLGFYSQSQWRTYMDDQGDFYLTGSNNNFLAWSGQLGTLQVQGTINIQGGNAATTSSVSTAAANAVTSASAYSTASSTNVSNSLAPNIFTDSTGQIRRPPTVQVGTSNGLFLGSSYLGYYSGSDWKTYMDNSGQFYLTGSASNYLKWNGSTLTIAGAINITAGGNAATVSDTANAVVSGSNAAATAGANAVTSGSNFAANAVTSGSNFAANAAASASLVDSKVFTNTVGLINKVATPSGAGLYLGSTNLGYYDGGSWKSFLSSSGLFYLTGSAGGNALLWNGSQLTIKGSIIVTGGDAATETYASGTAYTQATTAQSNAISAASSSAFTMATTSANTAYNNATQQLQLLADGGYSGSFIGSTTIYSPNIGGANGYISNILRVGQNGITLNGSNKSIYVGNGTYANANTPFYFASGSTDIFSLGNKLTWDGNTLTVNGNILITGGNAATTSSVNAKYDASNPSGYQANGDAKTAGSVGGWLIDSNKIYNSNVEIDNTNNRIDFKSSGVVKTRIKSGNANIGSVTSYGITIAAGSDNSDTGTSSPSYTPLEITTSNGGNGSSGPTFTMPVAANGLPFSLTIPYPAVPTIGYAYCYNLGGGASWQYQYNATVTYTIRLNNSSGTAVASGTKTLYNYSWSTANLTTGRVDLPEIEASTLIAPNVATAIGGQVYWVDLSMGISVQARINPQGGDPISGADLKVQVYGWSALSTNFSIIAVESRAEYATNGAQIGSSEGTYVAFGDAAGSGYVGSFSGNVQIIGALTAGSVTASDKRAKTNVKIIDNGIDLIKKLNPVKFDWLQHVTGNNEFEKGYGFIADEIQNVLPELVYKKRGYTFNDFKHLEYTSFHAIAIKAIQELTEKVEKLEAKLSGSI